MELTRGTLSPHTNTLIPTVTDNLFTQNVIPANEVAVSFNPTTREEEVNGELTFGGVDRSKFTGEITFAPISGYLVLTVKLRCNIEFQSAASTSPSDRYWGIDQSITYGSPDETLGVLKTMDNRAGIVDTGSTLVLLAADAFAKYTVASGARPDLNNGLLRLHKSRFGELQSLYFHIAGVSLTGVTEVPCDILIQLFCRPYLSSPRTHRYGHAASII